MKTLSTTGKVPRTRCLVKLGAAVLLVLLPSCVVTDNYGYSSHYPRHYNTLHYGQSVYGRGGHGYHDSRYNSRNHHSADYHRDKNHYHPATTSSDKFRLLKYNENKKSSHPSGYHDADYWKSRGYSVKKNTFEKKDGKIVGSRKGNEKSHKH